MGDHRAAAAVNGQACLVASGCASSMLPNVLQIKSDMEQPKNNLPKKNPCLQTRFECISQRSKRLQNTLGRTISFICDNKPQLSPAPCRHS